MRTFIWLFFTIAVVSGIVGFGGLAGDESKVILIIFGIATTITGVAFMTGVGTSPRGHRLWSERRP